MRLPEATDLPEADLARRAAHAVLWQGLSYTFGKLLTLGSTIVLARLLAPEEFGLVALAMVFIVYADVITDLGVAEALVYLPKDRRRTDVALVASLLFAAVLVGISFAAAPLVARFFDRPDLEAMFRVLALSLFVGALGQVPDALLRKELRFRHRLFAELARNGTQAGVSVALALAGLGAWAIVYGYLAGAGAFAAVAWSLVGYRPGRRFWKASRSTAGSLLAFGLPAAGNRLLLSLIYDVDYLIVGGVLGAAALGYYSLAFRIPQALIITVFYALSNVAFPVFTKMRGDPDRLRAGYLAWVRVQTIYGVGAGVALCMVAPMLVRVAFGSKWSASVVPLQALALYASFRSLSSGAFDLYKGIGRPWVAFWLSLLRLGVVLPALLLAVRFGIGALAWTQAGAAFVLVVAMQGVAIRALRIPARDLLRAVWPAVAGGSGTAIGAGAVRLLLHGTDALMLVCALGAGATTGLLALHGADRTVLREVRSLFSRPAAHDRVKPRAPEGATRAITHGIGIDTLVPASEA